MHGQTSCGVWPGETVKVRMSRNKHFEKASDLFEGIFAAETLPVMPADSVELKYKCLWLLES